MSSKNKREAVIELFKMGRSAAEIAKALIIPRRTVYDAVKRYKELGTSADHPWSGRPATATTPQNQNKVACRIRRNPEQSMQKMARKIGISKESVRRIVQNKLKLRSYKLGNAHFLNEEMKHHRLKNARRLLKMKSFSSILFTDEKIFTIEQAINPQNDQ